MSGSIDSGGSAGGRWVRHDEVLWRRMPDRIVLLAPGASTPTTLRGSGPRLWDLFAEPAETREVAQVLAAEHGVDDAAVERDIAPVVVALAQVAALRPAP